MKQSFIFLLNIIATFSFAQTIQRKAVFTDKERLEKRITGTSVINITRGHKSFEIDISSDIVRLYTVSASSDNYKIKSSIVKIKNIYSAMGKQVLYNSEQPGDTSSVIVRSLQWLLNKPIEAVVYKNGVVDSVEDLRLEQNNNDILSNLSAVAPELLIAGSTTQLIANLSLTAEYKSQDTWIDSVGITGGKQVMRYFVKDISNNIATVSYNGIVNTTNNKTTSKSIISGQMDMDINTGIILKNIINTKISNTTKDKKGLLTISRENNVTEVITKK